MNSLPQVGSKANLEKEDFIKTSSNPLKNIPDEIINAIFNFSSPFDLLKWSTVCQKWNRLTLKNDRFWRKHRHSNPWIGGASKLCFTLTIRGELMAASSYSHEPLTFSKEFKSENFDFLNYPEVAAVLCKINGNFFKVLDKKVLANKFFALKVLSTDYLVDYAPAKIKNDGTNYLVDYAPAKIKNDVRFSVLAAIGGSEYKNYAIAKGAAAANPLQQEMIKKSALESIRKKLN